MDYIVALEGGWIVEEVEDIEDAISVAISEAGKRLNPDKDYVEVDLGYFNCPACGEPFESVAVFAGTALVGLVFEITVYNVESEEHAVRIAKKEVGSSLGEIPLEVAHVAEKEEED